MHECLTKRIIMKRTMELQLLGFMVLLFLIVGDETLDFPHTLFGAPATPINWAEAIMEGTFVFFLCAFSMLSTRYFIRRVKFLEGFMSICAHCKKIQEGDDWVSLEKYMIAHSEAQFSHGVCPECAEKYYGEFLPRPKIVTFDSSRTHSAA